MSNSKFAGTNIEIFVQDALNGDKVALNKIIDGIHMPIYNLSLRFFWEPMDAEDATQEILIKVLTHLSSFNGESKFLTWAYKIGVNYLINAKRKETENITFEVGEQHLALGLTYPEYNGADKELLAEEVKLSCSTSMIVCLSRPLRLAYLLGEILEFDHKEGSYILDIDPATFRKRVSIARQKIREFMGNNCGLFKPENPCRCNKQISHSLEVQWFEKDKPRGL